MCLLLYVVANMKSCVFRFIFLQFRKDLTASIYVLVRLYTLLIFLFAF